MSVQAAPVDARRIAVAPDTRAGQEPRRPKPFDRPRFLPVFTALVYIYFFAPILVVTWFSFNSARSLQVFKSFSLTWYVQLFHDPSIIGSLGASIEVAFATMVVSAVIGTMLAFGLVRARTRLARPTDVLMLLNLVSPEIVTAIAFLLVFTKLGLTLSLQTVIIGHITFSIAYVTIIIRGRLATINREVEEAAQDLGANNLQALRLVTLPLLWPAIIASGMLVFAMSFDDFITTYFTTGVGTQLLPLRIYSMIRFGVTPEINAIGSLMMVITVAIVLGALAIFARQQSRQIVALLE
jgi:spermidine/putrescine transport system permease protein